MSFTVASTRPSLSESISALLSAFSPRPSAIEIPLPSPHGVRRLFAMVGRLFESSSARMKRQQEAYLAEATDLYDLEHRMRELDRNDRSVPNWLNGASRFSA